MNIKNNKKVFTILAIIVFIQTVQSQVTTVEEFNQCAVDKLSWFNLYCNQSCQDSVISNYDYIKHIECQQYLEDKSLDQVDSYSLSELQLYNIYICYEQVIKDLNDLTQYVFSSRAQCAAEYVNSYSEPEPDEEEIAEFQVLEECEFRFYLQNNCNLNCQSEIENINYSDFANCEKQIEYNYYEDKPNLRDWDLKKIGECTNDVYNYYLNFRSFVSNFMINRYRCTQEIRQGNYIPIEPIQYQTRLLQSCLRDYFYKQNDCDQQCQDQINFYNYEIYDKCTEFIDRRPFKYIDGQDQELKEQFDTYDIYYIKQCNEQVKRETDNDSNLQSINQYSYEYYYCAIDIQEGTYFEQEIQTDQLQFCYDKCIVNGCGILCNGEHKMNFDYNIDSCSRTLMNDLDKQRQNGFIEYKQAREGFMCNIANMLQNSLSKQTYNYIRCQNICLEDEVITKDKRFDYSDNYSDLIYLQQYLGFNWKDDNFKQLFQGQYRVLSQNKDTIQNNINQNNLLNSKRILQANEFEDSISISSSASKLYASNFIETNKLDSCNIVCQDQCDLQCQKQINLSMNFSQCLDLYNEMKFNIQFYITNYEYLSESSTGFYQECLNLNKDYFESLQNFQYLEGYQCQSECVDQSIYQQNQILVNKCQGRTCLEEVQSCMKQCEKQHCEKLECLPNNYGDNDIRQYMVNTCFGLPDELQKLGSEQYTSIDMRTAAEISSCSNKQYLYNLDKNNPQGQSLFQCLEKCGTELQEISSNIIKINIVSLIIGILTIVIIN